MSSGKIGKPDHKPNPPGAKNRQGKNQTQDTRRRGRRRGRARQDGVNQIANQTTTHTGASTIGKINMNTRQRSKIEMMALKEANRAPRRGRWLHWIKAKACAVVLALRFKVLD